VAKPFPLAAAFATKRGKDLPQGLKPLSSSPFTATGKPVPFVESCLSRTSFINTTRKPVPSRQQPIKSKQPDFVPSGSLQSNQQVTSPKGKLIRKFGQV
jgi:hypothetical protein